MIPGLTPFFGGYSSNSAVVSTTYIGETDLSAGSNPSASVSLGIPNSNRRIVIIVNWGTGGASTFTLSSASIGGIGATIHDQRAQSGGSTGLGVALISAPVPTGSSGTVSLAFTGNVTASIGVYNLNNQSYIRSTTSESVTTTTSISTTLTVPANGTIIAGYTGSSNTVGTSVTWSGNVTKKYDQANAIVRVSSAFASNVSAGTPTITATQGTISNAGNDMVTGIFG